MSCFRCGKCCHWFSITLSFEDVRREPKLMDHVIPLAEIPPCKTRTFMLENGHRFVLEKDSRISPCVFLSKGDPSTCTIYETRPDVCRNSPSCERRRTPEEEKENDEKEKRNDV